MAWALDLDGVMWLGETPIPGAADAVARLRAAGEEVVFVTNNSSAPVAAVEAKLGRFGVEAGGAVVTSAMAAASLVDPGETALVCAGPGVTEALEVRGVTPVHTGPADAVVVGFHRDFDYDRMEAASTAVREGARLIGTNDDATYPTERGPVPGGGAILAAVATAAGVEPEVAGKPHGPMAALVRGRVGADGTMVGDRPSTDGRFARSLGWRFALVLSGVSAAAPDGPGTDDPVPDVVAPDLAALVDAALAR